MSARPNLFEQLLEAGLADLDLRILSPAVRLVQADGRGVLRTVTDNVLGAVRVGPAANDQGGGPWTASG